MLPARIAMIKQTFLFMASEPQRFFCFVFPVSLSLRQDRMSRFDPLRSVERRDRTARKSLPSLRYVNLAPHVTGLSSDCLDKGKNL